MSFCLLACTMPGVPRWPPPGSTSSATRPRPGQSLPAPSPAIGPALNSPCTIPVLLRHECSAAFGPSVCPRGIAAVGIFLLFGAVMASLAGTTLVWQGTALDRICRFNTRQFWLENRNEYSHAHCDGVVLGVRFVRHEFARVSPDWPGNPCASTLAELAPCRIGRRCGTCGSRPFGLSVRSSEQSVHREDSISLAACGHLGRTSRSIGTRPGSKPAEYVSLP